jgi:hypothetical protein
MKMHGSRYGIAIAFASNGRRSRFTANGTWRSGSLKGFNQFRQGVAHNRTE